MPLTTPARTSASGVAKLASKASTSSIWPARPARRWPTSNQFPNQNNSASYVNPIQVPHNGGQKVKILGIPMVIRIHGRDTGGVVSAVESHDLPGGGPPPHIPHREDETFQILEGDYQFNVDGKTFVASKGT